uniref:non-specific serine/threonine protein kinase n=1 Tax=Aegilops tauschii subsp. strangulata TaxID=200361 RepID=A0A453HHC8_AEGTS
FCGLEWHQRYIIIKGICHGLRHLHEEQKIIHMDLKPQNILMDPNMVPKITDFGLSRLIGIQQSRIITMNNFGTLGYMAPEYSHHGTIKFKSDIYSLGVILLELITGTRMPPNIENVHKNWKNRLQETLSYSSVEASYKQVKRCVQVALNCMETDSEKRPSIGEIVKILNEIETGYEEDETPTSTQLLCIHPLELRFPFKPNHSITCPLHLTNNTDHRVAFRLQPERLERYFTEWLCGVAPPRSTYTLIVTMRDRQQSLPATDEFLIEQSRLRGETELKDISQGKAETEYDNFFTEVKEKGVDPVLEQTLTAVCDPEGNITAEIISTVDFDKMVSMDVHPTKPWDYNKPFQWSHMH